MIPVQPRGNRIESAADSVSVELIAGRWTVLLWRRRQFIRKFVCSDASAANRLAAQMQSNGLKRVKAGGRK